MGMMVVWLRAWRRPWKEAVVVVLARVAGWNGWQKERVTVKRIVIEYFPEAG
jgi:hypothetical protein